MNFEIIWCCSVLQCVAMCCRVLQCVAVYFSALYYVALCSMLQHVAACCSVLQCIAVCCSVWQCFAVCGSALSSALRSWGMSIVGAYLRLPYIFSIHSKAVYINSPSRTICVKKRVLEGLFMYICIYIYFNLIHGYTMLCEKRYRVAKTHRIPYLYRSFSAKVTYI